MRIPSLVFYLISTDFSLKSCFPDSLPGIFDVSARGPWCGFLTLLWHFLTESAGDGNQRKGWGWWHGGKCTCVSCSSLWSPEFCPVPGLDCILVSRQRSGKWVLSTDPYKAKPECSYPSVTICYNNKKSNSVAYYGEYTSVYCPGVLCGLP